MNLTTETIENKINKTNSMWFSGHRTSKKRKRPDTLTREFLSFYLTYKGKAPTYPNLYIKFKFIFYELF